MISIKQHLSYEKSCLLAITKLKAKGYEIWAVEQTVNAKRSESLRWHGGFCYAIISYYEKKGKTVHKHKTGTQTTCYFAKKPKGIIPQILETLLQQRSNTRNETRATRPTDQT